MKIIDALKAEYGPRLDMGGRWLYWDETSNVWVVREKKYGARKTTVIIETEDEDEAVSALMKED